MDKNNIEFLVAEFRLKIKAANKEFTKKEIFKDLLHRLYPNNTEIGSIIDSISQGSEYTVLNIPRGNKLHRGSADTLYNKIIIEFEANLSKTEKHAKEQLAGYLLGQFNSGEGYNYTLIASDFIQWKVFAPDTHQIANLDRLLESELTLIENTEASFELQEGNELDFFYWIDRFLFREEKVKATLLKIETAFGQKSALFYEAIRIIEKAFIEAKKFGQVQVSIEQWRRFLSVAYGKFEGSDRIFLIHTYLSAFSKLLAYSIVSKEDYVAEDKIKSVIDGILFENYGIRGFVENDFFHWVNIESVSKQVIKAFRLISQEISNFSYDTVEEDILKGVYQELIDIDTRHALGEYYTPDWLCERVVAEFDFQVGEKVLDPSCGSGSFLRAFIQAYKTKFPEITIEQLNDAIYGIDIHPLSVQIAKTTVLIAFGDKLNNQNKPIRLNVLMANTLLAPDDALSLYDTEFKITIDRQTKLVSTSILDDPKSYDQSLDFCDELALMGVGKQNTKIEDFNKSFVNSVASYSEKKIIDSFYQIYLALKKTKEDGRDTIWKYVLSNSYKPFFLRGKFDYVIGNPPWFTYAAIKNEEYQNLLFALAQKYQLIPTKKANMPHLEIAAIFMAHCGSYFLKELNGKKGKLAFVLPRSFFAADQHQNTRNGDALGFRLTKAWDLANVKPLFNIPSCVLFAEKANGKRAIEAKGIDGKYFTGNLPRHNLHWADVSNKIIERDTKYKVISQGKATALSEGSDQINQATNPYKTLFKQGATIVPRTFYFVEFPKNTPADFLDKIITVQTANSIKSDAKKPWKDVNLHSFINSENLFYTCISRSIFPYAIVNPDLVLLPITININNGIKEIKMRSNDDLALEGKIKSALWFRNCENLWNIHRTEKSESMTYLDRINFQRGITSQNLNKRYIVIYNASAKDANAGIVDRQDYHAEFIVESKVYAFYTNVLEEAYYLIAFLNSQYANLKIKDFQSTGLFGPRDVHKKILDVYFPKFNAQDKQHIALATASENLAKQVKAYLSEVEIPKPMTAIKLGSLRVAIKKAHTNEFAAIEKLIESLLG